MTDIGTAAPAFFGFGGATLGLILANLGAAYGMFKAGVSQSEGHQAFKTLVELTLWCLGWCLCNGCDEPRGRHEE